jgi:hypothetical protein
MSSLRDEETFELVNPKPVRVTLTSLYAVPFQSLCLALVLSTPAKATNSYDQPCKHSEVNLQRCGD